MYVCMYDVCMYMHPRGALMGGLLELSFLSSTRSITTTVSEYCYGWPPERYLPSFCGSNLEKAEDTVKVCSKWRPTAIIYLTTRAVIDEQRARKTCFRKNVAGAQGKKPCMFMHVSCMILHCMHDATCRHNKSCMIMHASGMVILNARKESV